MSNADKYVHGSWNVICQRCGFKYKGYQLEKEYTGHLVCHGPGTNDCWEPRHPQEFVKVSIDNGQVAFIRAEPEDGFVEVDYLASNVGVQE